jgi:hypothetical protein
MYVVFKMNIVLLGLLAFALSPGVLLRLPPGGNTVTVAFTHALILTLVWGLTQV